MKQYNAKGTPIYNDQHKVKEHNFWADSLKDAKNKAEGSFDMAYKWEVREKT